MRMDDSWDEVEGIAREYFDEGVTDRERAVFEGAIALGALCHQFLGTPIARDEDVVEALEEAMERSIGLQPYKEEVKVKIDLEALKGEKRHPYDYEVLKGEHLDVKVVSRYGRARATLRMRYIEDLGYNLMYIERIEEVPG